MKIVHSAQPDPDEETYNYRAKGGRCALHRLVPLARALHKTKKTTTALISTSLALAAQDTKLIAPRTVRSPAYVPYLCYPDALAQAPTAHLPLSAS